MYSLESCTLPLLHGSVYHLPIHGNGYIVDVDWYEGGYMNKYIRVHYLTSPTSNHCKTCIIRVLEKGQDISESDIELTTPLKTIILDSRVFLIVGIYL